MNTIALSIVIISLLRIFDYINFINGNIKEFYYCHIFPPLFCFIFLFEYLWCQEEERINYLSSHISSECLDFLHDSKKFSRSIKKFLISNKEDKIFQIADKNLTIMEKMSNLLELNLEEKNLNYSFFL